MANVPMTWRANVVAQVINMFEPKHYLLFDGFSVVANSDREFVKQMQQSAILLAHKELPAYMDGFVVRLGRMHGFSTKSNGIDGSPERFVRYLKDLDFLKVKYLM